MSILKKKVEVIMLPTNQKAQVGMIYLYPKVGIYNQIAANNHNNGVFDTKPQHLYFVDDSPIKEGDWKYNPKIGIWQHKREGKNLPDEIKNAHHPDTKKVIATTDKSLEPYKNWTNLEKLSDIYLPQPSDSFIASYIKAFNEGNPIKYVMVDYEYSCGCQGRVHDGCEYEEAKLKTDKSNTITITRCKENYSAEEVNKILDSFAERFVANTDTAYKKKDIFDWKIQNL